MGLVLEVTTPEELLPRARHYAEELASKQLDALMLSKKLINGHLRQKVEQVLDIENDVFLNIIGNFRKVSKM
jgi:enoyl-CoA hydratase/carnithine racemase